MTSCINDKPDIFGCKDPEALNFNPDATYDAENCIVPEWIQRVLIIEQTATWCSACPSAGAYMMDVTEEYHGDVILVAIHGENSDPMEPDCFLSFQSDRYSNVYPAFFISDFRVLLSPDIVYDTINNILASKPVIASSNLIYSKNENNIDITTRTKFFMSSDHHYYQSVFIMEKNIYGGDDAGPYDQVNAGPNYKHQHVLRAAVSGTEFYGEKLNDIPVVSGELIDKDYQIEIDPEWIIENVYFVIVIWKYNPSGNPVHYLFVNATEVH
ncbi:Omp28-related outer membrane protein [Bacteroidota bacterium]